MFVATAAALLVVMAMVLARAFLGPNVFDRILAVNSFGTLTVVMLAIYGFLTERPEFLDIALLYALINFVGTIAVTKFIKMSQLGYPHGEDEMGDV